MRPRDPARRTLELVDELGLTWGPEGRVSLSIHRVPHEVLHALGGRPLGWEVVWFADAEPDCSRCRALLDGFDAATEIVAQIEGTED